MAHVTRAVHDGASYAPFHRDGQYILHPRSPMSWTEFESARRLYGATIDVFALPDEATAHAARFGLLLEEVAA